MLDILLMRTSVVVMVGFPTTKTTKEYGISRTSTEIRYYDGKALCSILSIVLITCASASRSPDIRGFSISFLHSKCLSWEWCVLPYLIILYAAQMELVQLYGLTRKFSLISTAALSSDLPCFCSFSFSFHFRMFYLWFMIVVEREHPREAFSKSWSLSL